jgi:hypothetical protein
MDSLYICAMDRLKYLFVWLSRLTHSYGFGIQSPSDYWLVRYVINEHWPYYQYEELGNDDDWLTKKLGRLYFRLANWRQPTIIESDGYREYMQAGCKHVVFGESSEMVRLTLDGDYRRNLSLIYNKVLDDSILIVEGIRRDIAFWHKMTEDERVRVSFDLYYCGIVLFDKKRHKQNYIINF